MCDSGRCRDRCTDDSTCFNGEVCGNDGKCAPVPVSGGGGGGSAGPECLASADCGACEACVGGSCEILPRICATDSQCGLEKDCVEGFCNFQCSVSADCPFSQICDQGTCVTDPTPSGSICTANADCGAGACVNGICFDACQSASDCGDKMICDEGVCQPDWRPGFECRNQMDCPEGGSCVDGMCTVACFRDSECRTGHCDSGFCTPPKGSTLPYRSWWHTHPRSSEDPYDDSDCYWSSTDLDALANFSGGILLEALVLGHSHYKRAEAGIDQTVETLGDEGPLSDWSSEAPVPYESEVDSV